jgi:hypothetical protein
MGEDLAIDYPALIFCSVLNTRYRWVWLQYLDASRNSINFTRKMTLVLVSTDWLMSGTHIDDIGVIQKSTAVSVTKVVFPLGQCILIGTDENDSMSCFLSQGSLKSASKLSKAYPSEVQSSICCLIRWISRWLTSTEWCAAMHSIQRMTIRAWPSGVSSETPAVSEINSEGLGYLQTLEDPGWTRLRDIASKYSARHCPTREFTLMAW